MCVGVGGEGVVNRPHDLVHALYVSDARVQLGVDEQDSLHHLPVRLAAVRQNFILVGWVQVQSLAWGAHLRDKDQSEGITTLRKQNTTKPEPKRFSLRRRADYNSTLPSISIKFLFYSRVYSKGFIMLALNYACVKLYARWPPHISRGCLESRLCLNFTSISCHLNLKSSVPALWICCLDY